MSDFAFIAVLFSGVAIIGYACGRWDQLRRNKTDDDASQVQIGYLTSLYRDSLADYNRIYAELEAALWEIDRIKPVRGPGGRFMRKETSE